MIEVRDLYKSFPGGGEALRGVSLDIKRGEFVAIMGPSGSGKSTLLSLLGALDLPSKGNVKIDGAPLAGLSGDRLADFRFERVGFIFQQYYLLPTMTALGNVMAPLLPRNVEYNKRRRAMQLLDAVGLGHKMASLPTQLSGGEQQRVCIARALVNSPPLLLADEPTGALDVLNGEIVLGVIQDLRESRGLTVVMVTHDQRIAERTDRIIGLVEGRINE